MGQQGPFDRGREQMKVLAGLEVTAKSVERTAEAIGADIAAREQREIRKAVQLNLPVIVGEPIPILYVANGWDRSAGSEERDGGTQRQDRRPAGPHTRSQAGMRVHTDRVGRRRLCHSRSGFHYLYWSHRNGRRVWPTHVSGSLEPGLESRAKEGCHGDGAEWIWNLADQHFPGAVQIVDLYHARQHLWDLARRLYPNDPAGQQAWIKVHQKRLLDKGKIEKLVLSLRSTKSTNTEVLEKIRTEADYFETQRRAYALPKVPPSAPVHSVQG